MLRRPCQQDRVKVAVRVRPVEEDGGDPVGVEVDGTSVIVRKDRKHRVFQYDYVFTTGQSDVYRSLGHPMLDDLFAGYNVCLFTYGQTGSGKTYSMQGGEGDLEGIVPRLCRDMLQRAQEKLQEHTHLTVKIMMSFLEIYNERVRDLLYKRQTRSSEEPPSLTLYERDGRVLVRDCSTHQVMTFNRIQQLLQLGMSQRQTCPTNMNVASSRSHSVMQFTITQTYDPPDPQYRDLSSTITLVDLAGSERLSKSELQKLQWQESRLINQSLLTLGQALNHFSKGADGAPNRVPFLRASKLTRLLSDCFGGNARTWMLATVSPSVCNYSETVSTLEYAQNAKSITTHAQVNRVERALEVKELREKCRALDEQVDQLRARVDKDATALFEVWVAERTRLEETLDEKDIPNEPVDPPPPP